jgi:hypothetical protein
MLENDNDPYGREQRNGSRLMTLGIIAVALFIGWQVIDLLARMPR